MIRENKKVDPLELAIENYGDEARLQFRPITSEADKKRDEAIHEIASMIGRGTFYEDAERIYEAITSGALKLSD